VSREQGAGRSPRSAFFAPTPRGCPKPRTLLRRARKQVDHLILRRALVAARGNHDGPQRLARRFEKLGRRRDSGIRPYRALPGRVQIWSSICLCRARICQIRSQPGRPQGIRPQRRIRNAVDSFGRCGKITDRRIIQGREFYEDGYQLLSSADLAASKCAASFDKRFPAVSRCQLRSESDKPAMARRSLDVRIGHQRLKEALRAICGPNRLLQSCEW